MLDTSQTQYYYLKTLLPRPIDPLFYKIAATTIIEKRPVVQGQWILVSLQGKKTIGLVLEIFTYENLAPEVLDFIDKIHIVEHVFTEKELNFHALKNDWLAMLGFIEKYYHTFLGEVLRLTTPKMIKNGLFIEKIKSTKPLKLPLLQPLKSTEQKKLILNQEQQAILDYWKEHTFNTEKKVQNSSSKSHIEVLFGVTGSGKTALIAATILHFIAQHQENNENKIKPLQILIMVPEIGLTPQLATQLSLFLNHPILLLHSQITELQRFAMWQETTSDTPQHHIQIIVGTRLSILTPLSHLALIIIDEEHDASFKQQEGGIPYCAKKVALWLAHHKKIPVILSSATPSLETYYFALNNLKGYRLNHLKQKFFNDSNSNLTSNLTSNSNSNSIFTFIKPNSNSNSNPNFNKTTSLASEIQTAIFNAMSRNEKTLVLHPRRGFSPVLQCGQCAWIPECPACEIPLVVHRQPYWKLRCHRCDIQQKIPQHCPKCGNQELTTVGRATQKIEEELQSLLLGTTKKLVRIDSDSTSTMKKRAELLHQAHNDADILLGTQMISKGHDFANVTTIIILDVDALLLQPFLKSQERLFSLLLQTIGRGGRRAQQTHVLIETNYQEQAIFQYAIHNDVSGFLNQLLIERKTFQLPPFSYQAKLKLKHKNLETLTQVSENIHQMLQQHQQHQTTNNKNNNHDFMVFPPFSLAKQGYDYQMNINLQSIDRTLLHHFITHHQHTINTITHKKSVSALWDIDGD